MQHSQQALKPRISTTTAPRTRRQHREAMSRQGDNLPATGTLPESSQPASLGAEMDLERRLADAEE